MEHAATPHAERRETPRTTLDKILYVNLEPHNGGIVLNVSDGGMAFQAIAPIQHAGPIRFWFSLAGGHDLEATGEVVWTDKTKKAGGMRFTNLPETTRAHIRDLLGDLPVVSRAQPAPAEEAGPKPARSPGGFASQRLPGPKEGPSLPPLASPAQMPSGSRGGDLNGPPYDIDYWVTPAPEPRSPSARGFSFGLIVIALIAAVGISVYIERHGLGVALVSLGEKLAGTPQRPPEQQASAPVAVAVPPAPVAAPPAGTAEPANPAPPTATATAPSNESAPTASGARDVPAKASPGQVEPGDDGEEDLAAARRYLEGIGAPRSSGTAAQFLWAAVEKGNAEAEFVLAGLYLQGDGVTKSCEQARVLLRAASLKGNTEAAQSLANLYRNSCS